MRAVVCKVVGGPERLVIEDVPVPQPAAGEVLIGVRRCGINFPDVLKLEDKYQVKPERPFIVGSEVSGVIAAVGEGVRGFAVGDRVFSSSNIGGLAGFVARPIESVRHMPEGMTFEDAASFWSNYATSYYAFKHRGDLKPGDTVLVLGAAGGVGLTAVELAKAMGARVIAACSSQEKVEIAETRGADAGVVYPRGPLDRAAQKQLSEAFKAAVGPKGADIIYDGVGGDYAEPALRAIAWEGRYLVIGFAAGEIPKIPLNLALLKSADIRGVIFGLWANQFPEASRQNGVELLDLYAAGKLKPHICARFPLDEGAKAIALLADRKATGKVIVEVS